HLAVVVVRRNAERAQPGVDGIDFARRGAVDDAGTLQPVREARERARTLVAGRGEHLEGEIRAVRRARDDVGLAQREKAADVLAYFRRRRGGEREGRWAAELLQLLA